MRPSRYLLILVILVFCSTSVIATGISGGNLLLKTTFVPNQVYEFNYALVANPTYDNNYEAYAAGGLLTQYVEFDQTRFENIPKKSTKGFTGRIRFPAEIDPPGNHAVRICVREECPTKGNVCGRTAACAQLIFLVLSPGIRPIVGLSASTVNRNDPVDFKVSISNLGKEDINSCSGYIDIFNINKEKVSTVQLDPAGVKSNTKTDIHATWNTQNNLQGNYSATAHVKCDNIDNTANTTFRIGTLDIKIKDYTKELKTGGFKRFVATVESEWNDPLDIYGQVIISDETGTKVTAQTATTKLAPWKELDMEAFIDTSNLEEKEYDIRITIFYAEKSSFLEGKINLITGEPDSEPILSALKEEEKPEKTGISSTALTLMLVIVVILLTVINLFLAWRNKKKK
ncbi:hypothetical protein ACFL3V_04585 [Nanoarchaeota archaeon]